MAQRVLVGFEALDKYSRDVMAKLAKKRNMGYLQMIPSLKIPLTFNFEEEHEEVSDGTADVWNMTSEIRRDKQQYSSRHLIRPLTATSHKNKPIAKPSVRPFSASGPDRCRECELEANCNAADRITDVQRKPRCKSAPRRTSWKSQVECIPNLDILCQLDYKAPIASPRGHRDLPRWSSCKSLSDSKEDQSDSETTEIFVFNDEKAMMDNTSFQMQNSQSISKQVAFREELYHQTESPTKTKIIDSSNTIKENNIVSLSIEDEIKKPNIKIITVRQQKEDMPVQTVSETNPIIYNIEHKRCFLNNWSVLQKDFITNKNDLLNQMSNPSTRASAVLQDNINYAKNLIKSKQSAMSVIKSNNIKESKRLSSAKGKINLHFLGADGTKHTLERKADTKLHVFAVDRTQQIFKDKEENKTHNLAEENTKELSEPIENNNIHISADEGTKEIFELKEERTDLMDKNSAVDRAENITVQKIKSAMTSVHTCKVKETSDDALPIINGVNPRKATKEISSHPSPILPLNSCVTSTKSTTNLHVQTPENMVETRKWSYISICKPLTPPECYLKSSPNNSLGPIHPPEVIKDTVRPSSKKEEHLKSSVLFTRAVVFQSCKGKSVSLSADSNVQNPDVVVETENEIKCNENVKKESDCQENVPLDSLSGTSGTSPMAEISEIPKSSLDGPKEEIPKTPLPSIPGHPNAFPVINIPTAQSDLSD